MNLVLFVLVIAVLACTFSIEAHEKRGRIFNGEDAEIGQFKFMAFIVAEELRCCRLLKETSICGGSIIDAYWVLTAAHCLDGMVRAIVYLGATIAGEPNTGYVVSESHFFIHPKWDSKETHNDIALIRIPKTEECEDIVYAPLPLRLVNNADYIFENKTGIIMGWGLKGNSGKYSNHLQVVNVGIMTQRKCQRILPYTTESDICIKTKNPYGSICRGDSGGPLILEESGELIGVASFLADNSCERGYENIFMRVTSYLHWIMQIINQGNVYTIA